MKKCFRLSGIKSIKIRVNAKSDKNIHQIFFTNKDRKRSDIWNPYQSKQQNTQKRLPLCIISKQYLDTVLTIVASFIKPLLWKSAHVHIHADKRLVHVWVEPEMSVHINIYKNRHFLNARHRTKLKWKVRWNLIHLAFQHIFTVMFTLINMDIIIMLRYGFRQNSIWCVDNADDENIAFVPYKNTRTGGKRILLQGDEVATIKYHPFPVGLNADFLTLYLRIESFCFSLLLLKYDVHT